MALETPTQLQNESTLNGELPIAEYVDVFLGVSNVYTRSGSNLTLACAGVHVKNSKMRHGSEYTVSFVNSTNHTNVYAN